MSGFTRAQSFNEGRNEALSLEIKELREKVNTLETQKFSLEDEVRNFKDDLHETKRALEHRQKELEESEKKFEVSDQEQVQPSAGTRTIPHTPEVLVNLIFPWLYQSQAGQADWFEQKQTLEKAADDKASEYQKDLEAWSTKHQDLEAQNAVLYREKEEQSARTQQIENDFAIFKQNSGVSESEQLSNLCKITTEVEFLRKQLTGKEVETHVLV